MSHLSVRERATDFNIDVDEHMFHSMNVCAIYSLWFFVFILFYFFLKKFFCKENTYRSNMGGMSVKQNNNYYEVNVGYIENEEQGIEK